MDRQFATAVLETLGDPFNRNLIAREIENKLLNTLAYIEFVVTIFLVHFALIAHGAWLKQIAKTENVFAVTSLAAGYSRR